MRKPTAAAVTAALILVATVAPATGASADEGHNPTIVASAPVAVPTGLSARFGVAADADSSGTTYQLDPLSGKMTKTTTAGVVTTLIPEHDAYLSAISQRNGTVYYVERQPSQAVTDDPETWLMSIPAAGGTPKKLADLRNFVNNNATDGANTYGFSGLPASCLSQFNPHRGAIQPVQHGGDYSAPTKSIATPAGVYIADAGLNVVLKVTYSGVVSRVAILPPEPAVVFDAALADRFGFPECSIGYRYAAMPSPSALTLGPDGNLYVTTLPTGYASLPLALRGGIYRVTPATGVSKRIIGSLKAAEGISATPSGTLYVAEYRGGTAGTGGISVVRVNAQIARPLLTIGNPNDVHYVKDKLYIPTDDALKVVTLTYK